MYWTSVKLYDGGALLNLTSYIVSVFDKRVSEVGTEIKLKIVSQKRDILGRTSLSSLQIFRLKQMHC